MKINHTNHWFQCHRKWNGDTMAVSSLLFKLVMRLTHLSRTKEHINILPYADSVWKEPHLQNQCENKMISLRKMTN